MRSVIALLTTILILCMAGPTWADDDVILGVVGDSLSDEYTAPFGGPFLGYEGFEWVTLLTKETKVSFGDFDPALNAFGQPKGFAFNHALKGQALGGGNTLDMFFPLLGFGPLVPGLGTSGQTFPEQAAALAQNFADGAIDAAVIQGGANDIFIHSFSGLSFDLASADFLALKAGILSAVDALLGTPVSGATTLADEKVLFALIPVFGEPDQQAAIQDINGALFGLAFAKGVPVFSTQASIFDRTDFSDPGLPVSFGKKLEVPLLSVASNDDLVPFGDPRAVDDDQCGFSNGTPPFGNGSGAVAFGTFGCPTEDYQLNMTQDDFVHATTLASGLIANDVLSALNLNYDFKVKLLKDKRIIKIALGQL